MTSSKKVAIITGGATGMGFGVAEALAAKGDWHVHIFDRKADVGSESAKKVNGTFHQVDVTDYASLAAAFKKVFETHSRIDFVFANAGIVGTQEFYKDHKTGVEPPPQFSNAVIDVNLSSVMTTTYLAQHYFRQTPRDLEGPRSIVITSSCGGLYGAPSAPDYSAAKFGCIGWTRSIAPRLWRVDKIRVNALLPGTVRTPLLPDQIWGMFPEQVFTPIKKIVDTVLMLLHEDGKEVDEPGVETPLRGQCVEVNLDKHYFRKQHEYCDPVIGPILETDSTGP